MSKPSMKVTVDNTKNFMEIINALKSKETLVGIPEEDGARKADPVTGKMPLINNAALLYINEFGSPLQNIIARPVMEIGIRLAQDDIAEQFKKCGQEVWSKGVSSLDTYYERAGFIASSSVKNAINNQTDIEGPEDSTLKARQYIGKSGFKGTKSLVVTGQMRNAITYLVSTNGSRKKVG